MGKLTFVKKKLKTCFSASVMALTLTSSTFASGPYNSDFSIPSSRYDYQEIECLALNIYFETRAVSLADSMSVSDVVLNRTLHTRFPNSICGVVKQGHKDNNGNMLRNKCQFSWYCDGKSDIPKDSTAWERSRKFARDFYIYGAYIGITEGSTHYHATYVKPYWSKNMDRITRIGSHIFYRMKGK